MSQYIDEYLTNSHWRRKENANINESFSSMTNYISSKLLANDFLMSLPKEQRDAHENGLLHIHNLETGGYIAYCCGHNLKQLLMTGIKTPSINSKPAKHFNSLMDHIMNWLYCSQMEMAGAQSFGDWDTLIAPFIKKEKLTYKEVKQQIQKLIFNLNFTMRSSSQTPFTNLTMNIGSPKFLLNEQAIIGGEDAGFTYGDCIDEIHMVDKATTEIMNSRDSTGKPFTFPILTINLTKKFPWESELADIIANNCANLGSFYFMNYVNSGIDEDILRSMCCRLSLRLDQMSGPKGMWNMGEGTGSLGVVTINLPRLGHDAKGNETILFELLSHRLELALSILKARKERIKANMKSMMPFNTMNGWSMKNYFMTIGILGFNEFTLNFMNKDILDKDAQDMMIKVLQFMRDWCMTKQQETRELINIEQVPAEGCSYRLAKVDKKLNNDIITLGTDAAPYYSSVYIPHNYEVDMIDRIGIEEKALPIFSGGTIFRTLLGEKEPSNKAVLDYIKMIANTKIPYFDITATFAVCEKDNKVIRGTTKTCPDCNSPTEVWSRVVGYYRPSSKYNIGKVREFETRKYIDIEAINNQSLNRNSI
jgi:ribonucleoside-triphosphate reductase (formate)